MSTKQSTHCPNCGTEIDVNELLYQQLEQEAQHKYQQQLAQDQKRLKEQSAALQNQTANLQETIAKQVADSLHRERALMLEKIEQEQAERIKSMESELAEKSKKVIQLNSAQAEIERLKRDQQSMRSDMELELEKKYSRLLTDERGKIKQQFGDEAALKLAEREQVIEQLKTKLNDAQRQAEQGSMQLQGEAQELVIEEWLRTTFPMDEIEEVKKGALGADTLQIINTPTQLACGSIYYESKRTKSFSPSWIEKFKTDIQSKGADVGVLVTQAMPDEMGALGQIDGVWVCTFSEFKNLSQVLRQSLIQISQALVVQENKGDKMGMLYDFLTGSEFRMQIEAIVEGFSQLKSDLESEKRAMQSAWKKREKQLDRVLLNTNYMYSSIKGIAGSAVQSVALLEMHNEDSAEKK
jgi:hypothetical protein